MMRQFAMTAIVLLIVGGVRATPPDHPKGDPTDAVRVECRKGSSLIHLSIQHHRKIGKVRIEVKDNAGRTLYLEEGKALTGELVRRLDKGIFPRGEHTMHVQGRDFAYAERFSCD